MFGEAGFEKIRINDRKDVGEDLGAGCPVGDLYPFPELFPLKSGEVLDVGEAVHIAKHGRGAIKRIAPKWCRLFPPVRGSSIILNRLKWAGRPPE
jgi:hypothetical protein